MTLDNANQRIITLLNAGSYETALPLLRQAMERDPSDWNNWYMAGQCCRFMNDFEAAVAYLKRALALRANEPRVLLGLGIAFQLSNRIPEAMVAFHDAIQIDPDYELAYNSLALTQEKQGKIELAFHTYDCGLKALSRRIVKNLRNDRSNPMFKHGETESLLWFEYATYGATYLAASDNEIKGVVWPSASLALEEERTERHAGLYWLDQNDSDLGLVRHFLPNYFETFRETLKNDAAYATLIDNKGFLLEQQGRAQEAKKHFDEAECFLPRGIDEDEFPRLR